MRRKNLICGACVLVMTLAITAAASGMRVNAEKAINALPAAGASVALGEGESFAGMKEKIVAIVLDNADADNADAKKIQTAPLIAVEAYKSEITSEESDSSARSTVSMNAAMMDPVLFTIPQISTPAVTVQEEANVAIIPKEEVLEDLTIGVFSFGNDSEAVNALAAEEELEEAEEINDKEVEDFSNLVIADVHDYVNVRAEASTESEIVGKLYDDSVGDLLEETEDGWYKIESGKVIGYVKAEFCVTGDEAVEMAKEVGTRIATVNTTTLKVRKEASMDSPVLGLVPIEEDLIVLDESEEGWVQVDIEEGEGFVSTEFVDLRTDFIHAESKEEEEARLKKEKEERQKALAAANAAKKKNTQTQTGNTADNNYTFVPSDGSDMGSQVIQYALQFVGNPYVYGGSSLTDGTDCSGFVMSVYANFGVSLPHSSTSDRSQGYAVDGLENAKAGDLVCYSGHVALYVGDNQIVHASTSKTGIIVSRADYKKILAVRRIF